MGSVLQTLCRQSLCGRGLNQTSLKNLGVSGSTLLVLERGVSGRGKRGRSMQVLSKGGISPTVKEGMTAKAEASPYIDMVYDTTIYGTTVIQA